MPMNKEIKNKWLDALLSREYEQGQGYLLNDGCYCCLGVLCDIAPGVSPNDKKDEEAPNAVFFEYNGAESNALLPVPLREELGITQEAEEDLTSMNDEGHSFREIAMWIKENL